MIESLILCEGFDDRDFLAGWLEHAYGWTDTRKRHNGQPPQIFAGDATEGLKGAFFFDDPAVARRTCIQQVGGKQKIFDFLRTEIEIAKNSGSPRVHTIVVVADQDNSGADSVVDGVRTSIALASSAPTGDPPWTVVGTKIEVVTMRAGVVAVTELDAQERLERVVTAAFAMAYPMRYASLRAWLQGRPEPSGDDAMATHWGAMAGWFAASSPADYLRRGIWKDAQVAPILKNLLAATGLVEVTKRLVSGVEGSSHGNT